MKAIYLLLFCFFIQPITAQHFTNIREQAGIDLVCDPDFHMGGGIAVLDYDNDGWEDVYITGGLNRDHLYRNMQDGTFEEVGFASGLGITANLFTTGASAADIDNDGWSDLYIVVRSTNDNLNLFTHDLIFRNNGDGTFTNITSTTGIVADSLFGMMATFGDYNMDGWLDIYVSNNFSGPMSEVWDSTGLLNFPHFTGSENKLYRNNGDLTFTDVTAAVNAIDVGATMSSIITDYDNDRDPDIYVGNDFGKILEPNEMLQNQYPLPYFLKVGESSGTDVEDSSMGLAVGDYNLDGWLDYYICFTGVNMLYQNNGDGTFTDKTWEAGVADDSTWTGTEMFKAIGWGCNFLDYNNDMWPDLYVVNGSLDPFFDSPDFGTIAQPMANHLYRNMGEADEVYFENVTDEAGVGSLLKGRGSVVFDFDKDGDEDIMIVNHRFLPGFGEGLDPNVDFYRNDHPNEHHWVKVKVEGTHNNLDGIGTHISVKVGGKTLLREVSGGSSIGSNSSLIAHFGLAGYDMIDTLEISWLGGCIQRFYNLPVDTLYHIQEYQFISQLPDTAWICAGDTLALVPDVPFSLLWNNGDTSNILEVAPEVSGNYSFVTTNSEGCTYEDAIRVEILPPTNPIINNLDSTYCQSDSAVELSIDAPSGQFFGPGISGNTFLPAEAGLGEHTISYIFVNSFGCVEEVDARVSVHAAASLLMGGLETSYCLEAEPVEVVVEPMGGTLQGPGIQGVLFFPQEAGQGTHTLSYAFTNEFGCYSEISTEVTVTICTNSEEEQSQNELRVYPNPFASKLILDFQLVSASDLQISLTNLIGQSFYAKRIHLSGQSSLLINGLTALPAGIYFLSCQTEDFQKIIKLVHY